MAVSDLNSNSCTKRPLLTVLTDPIPSFLRPLKQVAVFSAKKLLGRKILPPPKYTGHFAVTRSLVEGLGQLGIDFNYNPRSLSAVGECVVVLANIAALRQAIRLKQRGVIKKLFAGPNLVVLPTDHHRIVESPSIDTYLLNSPWTQEMYELVSPSLRGRTAIFPSGVDADWWWDGPRCHQPRRLLFYRKRPPAKLYAECLNLAAKYHYEVEEIYYGHYTVEQYRNRLHHAGALVHWAEQESQGISMLEAWAADVPTLVWNPGSFLWDGCNYDSSSSPYLSPNTGATFQNSESFEKLLAQGLASRSLYQPREWVLNRLTDRKSAETLLRLLGVTFEEVDPQPTDLSRLVYT